MSLDLKNTQEVISRFANKVIKDSKKNLVDKNASRELLKSLGYDLDVFSNSFHLSFSMAKHGVFQDRGIKGTHSGKSLDNFSYKPSSKMLGAELATGRFAKWAKRRGIRFRDENGRFAKGSYKQIGIAIALSVKKKGIKPSLWFTKPFQHNFNNLDDQIKEAFGLDVDEFMEQTLSGIKLKEK